MAILSNGIKRSLEFWYYKDISELRKIVDLYIKSRSLIIILEIVFNTYFLID